MKCELLVTSVEVNKIAKYDNGFTCEYNKIDGNLDRYNFIKNQLPYTRVTDIKKLQRLVLNNLYMQSDIARELFPRFTDEIEILNMEDFSDLYHFYQSPNHPIYDYEGNVLSTCLTFSDRFLKVWGFGDLSIEEFYKVVDSNSEFSEMIYDGNDRPYKINFLLNDEDFMEVMENNPKRIHEESAMFFLRELFLKKYKDEKNI